MTTASSSQPKVLTVEGLCTDLSTPTGMLRAVDDVSFSIDSGETLGLVGESGCGKSVTALSIMQLLPQRVGRIESGRIELAGHGDLVRKSQREMRQIRGAAVSMIFQEPMTSLNPVYRVGEQVAEAVVAHRKVTNAQAWATAVDMFRLVGIPDPEQRARDYPHKLSGGMRQRVMIAMAMACRPGLLLADEPTTALDVSIQWQILSLMKRLSAETGAAMLLITHDMGVIARMAQRVIVMYAGVIVETADVLDLFDHPSHPYTVGLLNSIPRYDSLVASTRRTRLNAIGGMVPNLRQLPTGCRFSDRCPRVYEKCRTSEPPLLQVQGLRSNHRSRCWLIAEGVTA